MCGIIGAALRSANAAQEVYQGLKRLEYRGYDSAGLSVLNDGSITTVKRSGRVEGLQADVAPLVGAIAIGHTRWATHGAPTQENAHPHVSGKFSVVHNGIIENWRALKERLQGGGAQFLSDTDSEVIVKLIEREYAKNGGSFLGAVVSAATKLKGSFAFAALCSQSNTIIAVRYKSPLVLGFGQEGVYLSSDIPALPQTVSAACVLQDGDVAYIKPCSARIFDFSLTPVTRVRTPVPAGSLQVSAGGYGHYMLKEICEEGRTVTDTAESFIRSVNVKKLQSLLRGADKIILTGCGTAYNAALVSKFYFAQSGYSVSVEIASELKYFLPAVTSRTVVLAVSQSGETADTLEAVSALKEGGASVVAVTNCGYSALTRAAHITVPVCAGAEVCVAATKSYTGQLSALYLLSRTEEGVLRAHAELLSLSRLFPDVISHPFAQTLARECVNSSAVFFLGRGADYAVAVEAALKLKEITYIFSDGYAAGELKHGTLALVDGATLSVFIVSNASLEEKYENAVEQVLSRGGRAAVVTTLPHAAARLKDKAPVWLLPECPPQFAPFICSCALQLVAYKAALLLGRDPDKPRNLAKSVTVE